jgi:hypothetical protein
MLHVPGHHHFIALALQPLERGLVAGGEAVRRACALRLVEVMACVLPIVVAVAVPVECLTGERGGRCEA